MSVKVKSALLFASGLYVAFDDDGNPIPEIQAKSAMELLAEYYGSFGFDFDGCEFQTQRPNGEGGKGKITLDMDGYRETWESTEPTDTRRNLDRDAAPHRDCVGLPR